MKTIRKIGRIDHYTENGRKQIVIKKTELHINII